MRIYIVFELRIREYDTALLLKNELESRGFTVELIDKQLMFKWRYREAIIIVPNLYNTDNFEQYNYLLNARNNYVINLQIEQVLSKSNEETGYSIPSGKAATAIHCCWGNDSYMRLLKGGVSKEKLRITGAPHLDFLRNDFVNLWYNKNEISKLYDIPLNKKWITYISSFSYANNEEVVNIVHKEFNGASFVKDFSDISSKSQTITLDWFEQLVRNNPDIVLIYRPHPAEKTNKRLYEINKKFPNQFKIISDFNIKQWIMISDQLITWFSTSIVESYFAKKMCSILRPIEIPKDLDAKVYYDANNIIISYEQLEKIVNVRNKINDFDESYFPIKSEKINSFYLNDEMPAYLKTADLVEELTKRKKIELPKDYSWKRIKYLIDNKIPFKYYTKKIYSILYKYFNIKIENENFRKKWAFYNLENEVDNFKFYKNDSKKKLEVMKKIRGISK